jgi:hypothetical protein
MSQIEVSAHVTCGSGRVAALRFRLSERWTPRPHVSSTFSNGASKALHHDATLSGIAFAFHSQHLGIAVSTTSLSHEASA